MLCTAATPKPPASRARRDRYRSYGVMSDGGILAESVDRLRMVSLKYAKYASRYIGRWTGAVVAGTATLRPVRGGYAPSHRQGACGGIGVHQQGAIGMPHVIQVGGAVAIGHYRQTGVLRAQPGQAAEFFGAAAISRFQRTRQAVSLPFDLGTQRAFEAQRPADSGHVYIRACRQQDQVIARRPMGFEHGEPGTSQPVARLQSVHE